MLAVNADGYLTEWNTQLKEITAFSREEVVGRQLLDFMTDEFLQLVADFLQNSREGVASRSLQIPFFSKAGEEVNIVLSVIRNNTTSGELTLEVALAEIEATVSEPLRSPVRVALDEDDCVTEWNEEAAELTLFLPEEVVGMKFLALITKPLDQSVARMIVKARRGCLAQPQRFSFFTKAAEELDLLLSAELLSGRVIIEGRLVEAVPDQTYTAEEKTHRSTLEKDSMNVWNCDTCDSLELSRN